MKFLRSAAISPILEADPLPPEDRAASPQRMLLDELYRRQAPRLLKLFTRRAGRADADDLVQETFSRLAGREEGRGGQVAEPDAYLSRVATNLLRDRAKFAVRRATAYHRAINDEVTGDPDPVGTLETRDALRRLDVAIQKLRPRTRQVFLLQRIEGMTYTQIADQMGISVKAVKKQMAKALFELRRDLGPL